MNDKLILNLLGLAMRARKITVGEEFVLKEITRSPKSVVFLAADSGANITKKVNDRALNNEFTLITHLTSDQLSKAIGKQNRRLILVNDRGFCKKFLEYLNS